MNSRKKFTYGSSGDFQVQIFSDKHNNYAEHHKLPKQHNYYSPFDQIKTHTKREKKTEPRKHGGYIFMCVIPCHCSGDLHVHEMPQPPKPNQEKCEKYI